MTLPHYLEKIYKSEVGSLEFVQNATCIINTLNAHSYCIAQKDKTFNDALKKSDILLPDGFGIVLAEGVLNGRKIKKISGSDLHDHFLTIARKKRLRIFYLGASEETLGLIKNRARNEDGIANVGSYSPPYKQVFTSSDTLDMINAIKSFRPDILFVGMTAPKQEKWVYQNVCELQGLTICSIGAVFDFYARTKKRPGSFWINIGLEWLPRLIKEPKRLFYRNFVSTPRFLLELIKFKVLSF